MVTLDGSVRMVVVQFIYSNPDAIPKMVRRAERETPEEGNKRRKRSSGVLVINPTENCSLRGFCEELERAKYRLVDAFYQKRFKDSRSKETYYMTRFIFARSEFVADISDEFKRAYDEIRTALSYMYLKALWRVRVFSNPFYKDSEEIPEQSALSINLEARKPLFRPDGQPIMAWQRDKNGKCVGDAPLPLKAEHRLRIVDDALQLVQVSR